VTTNGNLDGQREHWQVTFQANPNMYGTDPSKAGGYAAELFKQQHIREVVELGSGQGRDTLVYGQGRGVACGC
jgi:tRNA G46 methylase TrmB